MIYPLRWKCIFIWLSISVVLQGQNERLQFDHIGINDGLSQSTVYDILKDYQGFIWVTTAEGLNRYDGQEMVKYIDKGIPTSLSSIYTEKLYEDSRKNLWIATNDGLNKYNREEDNFTRYYPTSTDNKPGRLNSISDITEDESGTIWITTRNPKHHLFSYDIANDIFIEHSNPENLSALNRIVEYDENHLLLAYSDKRLFLFNTSSNQYTDTGKSLPQEALRMVKDNDGRIWIGTDSGGLHMLRKVEDGITSYFHEKNDNRSISSDVIWDIDVLDNNDLWLATDFGLNYFDQATQDFVAHKYIPTDPTSLSSNFLLCVYQDSEDILWVGTSESGLNVLHPSTRAFEHYNNQLVENKSLSNNAVWSINEDDSHNIWIGTSEGLNKLKPETGAIQSFYSIENDPKSLSHNRIWTIKRDPYENYFWLGTSGGLNRMKIQNSGLPTFKSWQSEDENPSSISSNSVRCLLIEDEGVWLGTSNEGLNYFDKSTERVTRYIHDEDDPKTISNNRVRQIFKDSKSRFWIATQKGLNLMDQGGFKKYFHSSEDSNTLSNDHVRVIKEDEDGILWIGTDLGLNRVEFNPDKSLKIKRYDTSDGLSNNRIYAIEVQDDYLWLSTNNGISRMNKSSETFDNFYQSDGLQSNEFNQGASYIDESGMVYFGGINGLNRFSPNAIEKKERSSQIVFTDFKVHFEDIDINEDGPLTENIITTDEIILNHNQRMFSIQFSALNFQKSVQNRFAYRLVPFEEDWNEIGNLNQAVYTNIPPGDYTFEVKTSNYGNVWSEDIGTLNIRLKPAFWETRWFRILSLLALILTIIGVYRYRLNALIKSREQLEENVRERTQLIANQKDDLERTLEELRNTQDQLIQQEKMATVGQMTAGIAHEINNPINYISNNTDALIMDISDVREIVKRVLTLSSDDGSEAIRDLIKLREDIDLEYLVKEIEDLVKGIKTGTDRTTEIIKSLRYISYRDKQEKVKTDVHESIDSAISILSNNYKERIEIEKNYGDIPFIEAYPGELNQVFINLINNSIQAIENNGVINIHTSLVDENHIMIRIKDNGKGISKDVQKHIFEPFYTTKDIGKGTGLGLSISYGIIESHNGKIELDSKEGEGTIFTIVLPI